SAMRSQKDELEVELAKVEAEVKSVRLAQTRSKFQVDDSRLARCKAALQEIRNRLKVEKTVTELQGEFANDAAIPVEKKTKSAADLTKEVRSYFGADKDVVNKK